jgi:hypothetical protein
MNKFLLLGVSMFIGCYSQQPIASTEIEYTEYDRTEWKHWIDADKDGQDTRQEVLIAENLADAEHTEYNEDSSRIIKGMWVCMYTGDTIIDPSLLDVDHFVPLKEAHISGGYKWSAVQKQAYANELLSNDNHLIAVSRSANRSKGAKDPSDWIPKTNGCWYIKEWTNIKRLWDLSYDKKEADFILNYLNEN